ncbi:MAG: putative surface protein with fasciclin (FAS1) repeats [Pontimonas sp.]|jgi:uncharacterized surface protein with fasciclin (FAS1) repeats
MSETHNSATETSTELGDIVAVATAAGSFGTLLAAATAAGLVETLQGTGPFTVFAPNDEAFAALPAGLVDALLKEENLATLVKVLTYHVVSGAVLAADVATGDVATVEGSNIAVAVGDSVVLNDSTKVIATDIKASNGVIHVVDSVLLPADVDAAALLS